MAPSFDHASSLGRELRDERRIELLAARRIEWYINNKKVRGGIFRTPEERHGENPLRLIQSSSQAYPSLFAPALKRVAALAANDVRELVELLPEVRASQPAKRFAEAMILTAQASLIELLT